MFEQIKEDTTRKMRELRMWTNNIDESDSFAAINKGLFYVYIYGIYEETIRRVVQKTIEELNNSAVNISDCTYELYDLIFSQEYDGLYNVGNEHKWEKRWIISEKLKQNPVVSIPGEVIPTDGKNIRYKQLESIAKSFGMQDAVLPRTEIGGYIQEMVNKRNFIAHGNKTPREVGREVTVRDLLHKLENISEICTYIIEEYEKYIEEQLYLKSNVSG